MIKEDAAELGFDKKLLRPDGDKLGIFYHTDEYNFFETACKLVLKEASRRRYICNN